jgi:hypothetical protein
VKRNLLLVAAAGMLMAMVGSALADTTTITDPRGDNRGGASRDLRFASAGHGTPKVSARRRGAGVFLHKVRVRDHAIATDPPDIFINTPGDGPGPEYRMGRNSAGNGRVFDLKDQGFGGPATIEKANRRTFTYQFLFDAIGCPARYGWQVVYSSHGKVFDRAPNRGYVAHDLSAAKRWETC